MPVNINSIVLTFMGQYHMQRYIGLLYLGLYLIAYPMLSTSFALIILNEKHINPSS